MDRNPPVIAETSTVAELADRIARGDPVLSRRQGTLMVDPSGQLAGIITRGDMVGALQDGSAAGKTVREAGTSELVLTHPDETLRDAIDKMLRRGIGRLPVVERENPRRAVGYLGRADILGARLRRQQEEEHREKGPLLPRRRSKPAAGR